MAGAEDTKTEIASPEGISPAPPTPEVVSVELPAPAGWTKKFTPKKGGTPRRNEIIFISPTGDEIRSKRQLDQYLRSHPGCPAAAEFDWGSGDTPRRSARISEKAKATETPEGESPKKRERKSSSKKGAKVEKDGGDGEDGVPEEAVKDAGDTEMEEAEDGTNKAKEVGAASEAAVNEGAVEQSSEDKPKEEEEKSEGKKVDEPREEEVKTEGEKVDEPKEEEVKTEGKKVDEPREEEVKIEEKNVVVEEFSKVDLVASFPRADEEKASEAPHLTFESKEEASAEKEIKDEEVKPVSGSHKDEREASITKEVHSMNYDDPQPPPKAASPVSC